MKEEKIKKPNIFSKILEDKKAIKECIQTKGNLAKLAKERGIKFVTPL